MEEKIKIGGELEPKTVENILGDASTIIDRTNYDIPKRQDDVNAEKVNVSDIKDAASASAVDWEDEDKPVSARTARVIKEYVENRLPDEVLLDDVPTINSNNAVKSGGTKTAIDNVAFSTNEKVKNVGIDAEPIAGSDNLVKSGGVAERYVLYKVLSANIHNNANAIVSSKIPNFLDWAAHSLSLVSSTRVDFISNSNGYNLSYYIPVVAGSSYKCTTNIRHLAFFDAEKGYVLGSYKDANTVAGTEIIAPANSAYIIIQYNAENYNPNTVRFGLYTDDIDVPFEAITYSKYGKEILSEDSSKVKSIEDSINEVDGKYESIKNDVLFYIQSTNIHNSSDAVESITQPDGVDWAAHSLSLASSHAVSFDTNTGSYNLTYYIPVIAGESYKCTTSIRKRAFFNNAKEYVEGSFNDTITVAGTEIVAPASSSFIIIQYNAENYTPDDIRFGLYSDDIDVPFGIEVLDKYNREIALKEWVKEYVKDETTELKTITAIGSSGLGLLSGGQYQLTSTQKTTYGVTSDLTLTRVIQILLGYDESNLCAVGGDTASVVAFNSGFSAYIIKNEIELPANKEYVNYAWDTSNIGALMTSNLSLVKTSNIFNFTCYVNGATIEVKPYAGQIRRVDSDESFVIPANTLITREPIINTYQQGSGTLRKAPINSYGLILQIGANSEGATPEEIVNYYDLAIKISNCKWFVCLAKNGNGTPEPTQAQGGTDLSCAETIELLKRKYGNRFIDHKPYMRSLQALIDQGITPTTSDEYPDKDGINSNPLTPTQIANGVKCDMQCIAEGIYPSSFWHSAYRDGEEQTINSSHFNAQGLECMGKFIVKMLNQMGIE